MRKSLIGLAGALALMGFSAGSANATVVAPHAILGATSALGDIVEKAQVFVFYWNGRRYCWYDDGWHGPGWYWCGYAWQYGVGWGGGWGWHGWRVPRHRYRHPHGWPHYHHPHHVYHHGRPHHPAHYGRPHAGHGHRVSHAAVHAAHGGGHGGHGGGHGGGRHGKH